METNSQVFLNSLFLHKMNRRKNSNKTMPIINSGDDIESELFQTK